ncbi:DNA cytosine methyltransferase [Hyalangium gracile]|uniref:DNA cytosine methyltransferase n=1 Tax=Hyalangium gracile TaxID=394092 RepID=UPI001CCD6171|nr:DNA cytosine methyltransferase [Hyalangium gracile]
MKSLELFTGAGGLALGTHLSGFEHVALVEWNKDACDTLRRNSREGALPGVDRWNVVQADIHALDFNQFGPVDLVAGGVPCQPFSLGGKHKGMNDERDMFPDFVRAVRDLRPKAFIIENVKGLLRQTFRNYFSYIFLQLSYPDLHRKKGESWEGHLRRLEDVRTQGRYADLQYNVIFQLLNAANYGIPQTRERVFIVGFRSDVGHPWHFPKPTHSFEALMREQWVTGSYWERHGVRRPKVPPAHAAPFLGRTEELFDATKPWRTIRDAIQDLPEPRADAEPSDVFNHRLNPGARAYPGHTGSNYDLPSKTLKAGVHGVPGGENMIAFADGTLRYLTVREAARIQTFPDRWRFAGSWGEAMRQLGNAVPMDLAAVVARSVSRKLKERPR